MKIRVIDGDKFKDHLYEISNAQEHTEEGERVKNLLACIIEAVDHSTKLMKVKE